MITRANNLVTLEGNVVRSPAEEGAETVRRRIEIDTSTGLITKVGAPDGSGDLRLGDEYVIFPGFVDCHVHAREDVTGLQTYKESFQSAGEAALNGGVVAYAEMPNCPEPPVDDATYVAKRELSRKGPVDALLYAGIGPSTRPLSFPVPYKVFMGPSVGPLFFETEESLREALARYRGQVVAFHAELPEILELHQGASSHAERRPPEAEIEAIDLALRLCDDYGLTAHICHLSTGDGLELIRDARERGQQVTCEVTPHHLFFDQDNIGAFSYPDFLQCNPPVRSRLDRIALLDGLREGMIDFLATDHAPHTVEEKESGTSGVPHLDTFGSFVFWLREEGLTLSDIQRVCSENPGKFISQFLPRRYGKIESGYCGSLTILKQTKWMVRRSNLKTKAGWSCFEGHVFPGRVSHTVVRGKIHPIAL